MFALSFNAAPYFQLKKKLVFPINYESKESAVYGDSKCILNISRTLKRISNIFEMLSQGCAKIGLDFNPEKSKILFLNSKNSPRPSSTRQESSEVKLGE